MWAVGSFMFLTLFFWQILVEKHYPVHLFSTVAFVVPSVFDAEQHGMDIFWKSWDGYIYSQNSQTASACVVCRV